MLLGNEMKIIKNSLPLVVMLCVLTSGCATNMDWVPKWDVGSTETENEKKNTVFKIIITTSYSRVGVGTEDNCE